MKKQKVKILFSTFLILTLLFPYYQSNKIEASSSQTTDSEKEMKENSNELEDTHEFYTVGEDGSVIPIDINPAEESQEAISQSNHKSQLTKSAVGGVLKLRVKPSANYNTSYTDVNGQSGYINGYYGGDAVYLGMENGYAKFMIAGVVGYMPANDGTYANYKIVSTTAAKSVSYYYVSGGYLYHKVASDVEVANSYLSNYAVGHSPSYLQASVNYYSYDGHYFYTDYQQMINDYSNGVRTSSVNSTNPYYNYYQYLTTRTKTTLTEAELNAVVNTKGSGGVMINSASSFISTQNTYGVNAVLAISHAALESAWGTSSYAKSRNNIFGIGAGDSNPDDASYFSSVGVCIAAYAKMISADYMDPKDYIARYKGGHYGDKASGINVKYASDPYSGEKIASIALSVDSAGKDYNKYQLAINEWTTNINIRKEASTSSTALYTTGSSYYYPIVILGESGDWYKIQSDSTLTSDRNSIIQDSPAYNFSSMYAYISKSYFRKVNSVDITPPIISNLQVSNVDTTGFIVSATITDDISPSYARIAVWSAKNGQDDLKWYTVPVTNNTVSQRVSITNHNNESGSYYVHMYAYDSSGNYSSQAAPNVVVPEAPSLSISDVKISEIDDTGYTVSATVSGPKQIAKVEFPTWTSQNGQDDITWGKGTISGSTVTYRVKVSEHNYEGGQYNTHIYAYDSTGKKVAVAAPTTTLTVPQLAISDAKISEIDATGYTVSATVNGPASIAKVEFPTWTSQNGQDDITWGKGTISGSTVTYRVKVSEHNYEGGQYNTHIYAYDSAGKKVAVAMPTTTLTVPQLAISNVKISEVDVSGYTVTATVSGPASITKVEFPTWTTKNGQDDITWGKGTISGSTVTYRVKVSEHKYEGGQYNTHIYVYDSRGKKIAVAAPTTLLEVISVTDVKVSEVTASGYLITATVSGASKITKVEFPTWTVNNGQDDITWGKGTISGTTVTYRVKVSEHKNETGVYSTHIYAYDSYGNKKAVAIPLVTVPSK